VVKGNVKYYPQKRDAGGRFLARPPRRPFLPTLPPGGILHWAKMELALTWEAISTAFVMLGFVAYAAGMLFVCYVVARFVLAVAGML